MHSPYNSQCTRDLPEHEWIEYIGSRLVSYRVLSCPVSPHLVFVFVKGKLSILKRKDIKKNCW